LETSPPKSNAPYFRRPFLWIVIAASILSLIFYWAFRTNENDAQSETPAVLAEQTTTADDSMIGVQPPSFQQISEFQEGSSHRLRLAGVAEPNGVIILTDRNGERLRQVGVNDQGQWGATLDVEEGLMVLDAQLYIDEVVPSIRSEETIFRLLPSSDNEENSGDYYSQSALIMVTAPGRPSRIIQSPFGGIPQSGPLGLSVIDYDHSGGVIITGTSSIPGRIRIYAQDAVIGETGIGVSGRWNYIAGRTLQAGEIDIRAELIAAQGIPNAPEGPMSISVPFKFLPPLKEEEADGSAALSVNIDALQWQIRRTLIGGGGQSTVIFSPEIIE